MAVKLPLFRKKFPLLVTGGLLALQPLASPFTVAAEQYDCSASATGGWACTPKSSPAAQLPRPQHSATAVSAAPADANKSADGQAQGEQPVLVTESGGRGLQSAAPTIATWTGCRASN